MVHLVGLLAEPERMDDELVQHVGQLLRVVRVVGHLAVSELGDLLTELVERRRLDDDGVLVEQVDDLFQLDGLGPVLELVPQVVDALVDEAQVIARPDVNVCLAGIAEATSVLSFGHV